MIHLDTNFLIQALVPGSPADSKIHAWLTAGENLLDSTATVWIWFGFGLTQSREGIRSTRMSTGCESVARHRSGEPVSIFPIRVHPRPSAVRLRIRLFQLP